MTPNADFERIFHPRRVAILGVSTQDWGFGRGIMDSLLSIGFEGKIYPVNPRGGEIYGHKIYAQVEDIPEDIDFAIIAVAAPLVPAALAACREKGAAGAEILSAGFRELGTQEGMALEEAIKVEAKKGIRVIGPNCFGIYCPKSGLTLLPGPDLSRKTGPVAFLSQSGGMAIDLAFMGMWMGFSFSKVVSFGNGADLREVDFLEYLTQDPETGIIALYIEGIEDGERFIRAVKQAAAKKPVIVYKGGLSESGKRAVASHTASMGGQKEIWEALIKQVGAVQVRSFQELCHTIQAFSMLPPRTYRGMTVLGGGGALGVSACDAAEENGLYFPALTGTIYENIYAALPKPGSSAVNPIDVANPFVPPQTLSQVMQEAAKDERVDIQVQITLFYHFKQMVKRLKLGTLKEIVPVDQYVEAAYEAKEKTGKPVVMVLPNCRQESSDLEVEEIVRLARESFHQRGIPVFHNLPDAMQAIRNVSMYYEHKQKTTS
ncbi:MAG TPA: CoA-binding protein [Syntrophales bacterium]|nr:CoA-binding protein [Syntrophales bacterium]HOL59410.1 CoA-binding protein [Syntrophales bacterium]HPO35567.1 CoA-binding protein [Syntrophales bacterium]